jgi:hypothetical protein
VEKCVLRGLRLLHQGQRPPGSSPRCLTKILQATTGLFHTHGATCKELHHLEHIWVFKITSSNTSSGAASIIVICSLVINVHLNAAILLSHCNPWVLIIIAPYIYLSTSIKIDNLPHYSLIDAVKRYGQIGKEVLAPVFTIKLHSFIFGHIFTLETDHKHYSGYHFKMISAMVSDTS